MRKTILLTLLTAFIASNVASSAPDAFHRELIGRKIKEFTLDSINLSSPLDYYLSRAWVILSGKRRYWADISTSMFVFDRNASDRKVSEQQRKNILDETIDGIVTYRASVAAIITHTPDNTYMLGICICENGRWVNRGQDSVDDVNDANERLKEKLPYVYAELSRILRIQKKPADESRFAKFLSTITQSPEEFILDKLAKHRLVINGEYHRRKVSWDALKRLIAMPEFPERAGTVFMELPSWKQPVMDEFLASETLDTGKILDIFRDFKPYGWWDRGEYEFIIELWKLNRTLPDDRKIKIILADYRIPYSKIKTKEAVNESEDRNTHMAKVISNHIKNSPDSRGNLFLVGCAHAYKSNVPGIDSTPHGMKPELTAGAQLAASLGEENVFTVFQHVTASDNYGRYVSALRNGVFDRAFEANGNRPIGFTLDGSPFGTEPFDGIYEIKWDPFTGTYADNFDGYLFLHPLASEPKAKPLFEIFSQDFIEEMKRRAEYLGTGDDERHWFGRKAADLTPEYIIKGLESDE